MVVPELSLMNINHRYYSIETFFKAAGEAGYRNIELWTGSMHLYVDCHEHDSVDKIRDLAAQYGIKIVCVCPSRTTPSHGTSRCAVRRAKNASSRTLRM